MKFSDCSFVVVDCETTGFHPRAHHRVIELALIPVDGDGEIGDPWCTLLNPERDLGPTDIHGIRGRDLLDAPRFDDVLGVVIEHLAGRIVVAHNATFDCAFLEAELKRAGLPAEALPALCTMRLANALGTRLANTSLADCCAELGVSHEGAHSALHDAMACAEVFTTLWRRLSASGLDVLPAHGCSPAWPASRWPSDSRRAASKLRGSRSEAGEPAFLSTLIPAVHRATRVESMAVAAYLDVLDRALEDRRLSPEEQEDLAAMARMLGLSADDARAIHADYLGTLIALAYRDGVITERERVDLELVSDALGLQGLSEAIASVARMRAPAAEQKASLRGQSVCFTGALLCSLGGQPITREIAHLLAEEAGLTLAERVTKKLDVLVVADPDSLSDKARKARDYGTRIVAETAFWPMIGVEVD